METQHVCCLLQGHIQSNSCITHLEATVCALEMDLIVTIILFQTVKVKLHQVSHGSEPEAAESVGRPEVAQSHQRNTNLTSPERLTPKRPFSDKSKETILSVTTRVEAPVTTVYTYWSIITDHVVKC